MKIEKRKIEAMAMEWHVRRPTSQPELTRIQPPASVISLRFTLIHFTSSRNNNDRQNKHRPVYSVQLASAHCSNYAIEIPVARSLDADPSLVILGLAVNAHISASHNLVEPPYSMQCTATSTSWPRSPRSRDNGTSIPRRVGCLSQVIPALPLLHRTERPEDQRKCGLLWAWKLS